MSISSRPSRALRLPLTLALGLFVLPLRAEPIISEFLASNAKVNADDDGKFSDWIEIHNPDAAPVSLAGWYLTDNASNKTKWQFPAVTVPAGGYLVVWASDENRRDPAQPLHTNFALSAGGDYLGLIRPDGVTAVTEFAPYPAQFQDVSYGITQPAAASETARRGFFRAPTPGARNGGAESLLLLERVTFSRAPGPFTGSFTLTLTGAAAGQRIRYVVAPPAAAGAVVPEPGPTSTEYTGPITIAASSIVRATVFAADNLARGFSSTAHYLRFANTGAARVDTFSSQLPLMVVDTHGTGPLVKDDIERPGWIYTWHRPASGNTTLATTPTIITSLTTNVRGASSATFPKKSYTVRLEDLSGDGTPLPLYGLPAHDHWALVGPWRFDRTYLHNTFVYALSNRLGRWAPRTQLVEVFFNANGGDLDTSDYAGIYVLTETPRVDEARINITSLSKSDVGPRSITGGYVLKSDLPDPNEYSFYLNRGFPSPPFALIVSEPKIDDLAPAQRDYVKGFLQSFDDALHADYNNSWQQRTYLDYIDRSSWVDMHLMNVLTMNPDAFVRSTYYHKDRGGRIVAGPVWDFDRTMNGGDVRSERPEGWSGESSPLEDAPTDLWGYGWFGVLGQDPEFVQEWIDRWQQLRRNELATANVLALVDSLAAQVSPAAAARDAARWPDNASRFGGSWQGEIDNLKSWLTRRLAWIDSQFSAAPVVVAAGGELTVTAAPGTQLAYTTDGTDPRAFGGALANRALLSSGPVVVPGSTDLHVRSYRPDFPNAVPSSAWSGLAVGPQSSVLSPRPRLINLSSRGFVGTDENVMIMGVVVNDTAGKQYLARAVGPGLTGFGVGGALAQPVLRILDSTGATVATNSGWETNANADDITTFSAGVGAFPLVKGVRDAALLTRLPFGQFTLQISSANAAPGVALAELYEIDPAIGRTIDLSTRGLVRAGEALLIGGLVVRGPAPKRLLIRAVGPTLGVFGVAGALADPVLELFSGSTRVAGNDDWGTAAGTVATASEITGAAAVVGAFALPAGSRDAALLLTLAEGPYTVQVSGKGTAEGVILLEVYEVQ